MEELFVKLAVDELEHPKFEVTKQYLKAFELVRTENSFKVERIELEAERAIVYFQVKGQKFFLEVYVNKNVPEVEWISIESGNHVHFRATSEEYSFQELASLTNLSPLTGWNKGDLMRYGGPDARYKFSALHFDPFPSLAYPLEYKLTLLLNQLSQDKEGIKALVEKHCGYISIASYKYTSQPGGMHFDTELIDKLHEFGLELDIDLYVGGNEMEHA